MSGWGTLLNLESTTQQALAVDSHSLGILIEWKHDGLVSIQVSSGLIFPLAGDIN